MRWIAPAIFLTLLAGVGIASTVVSRDQVDNRSAEQLEAPDLGGLMSGDWFTQTDDALADRLWIRDRAVAYNTELEYRAFNRSTNPEVLAGSDGWLYLTDTFTVPCDAERDGTLPAPSDVVAALDRLDEALGPRVDLSFAVVPEKAYLHADDLPSVVPDRECGTRLFRELTDHVADDPRYFNIEQFLTELQATDPEPQLYRRVDTHWTERTRATVVEELVQRIEPGVWDPSAVAPLDMRPDVPGDLSGLLGYDVGEDFDPVWVLRFDVTMTPAESNGVYEWNNVANPGSNAQLIEGKTVIITDSHFRGPRAMIAPWFENLVLIERRAILGNDLVLEHVRSADRVFISFTARNAAQNFDLAAGHLAERLDDS